MGVEFSEPLSDEHRRRIDHFAQRRRAGARANDPLRGNQSAGERKTLGSPPLQIARA